MNKKVFPNIHLTCYFQDAIPSFLPAGPDETRAGSDKAVFSGQLSCGKEGGLHFHETIARKRPVRNSPLYQGTLLNMVRRKDGHYYPFLKAFKPEDIQDKSEFAFKIYREITEALNIID